MSSDEIMADLDISRGGVSTQLKILKDAGLVDRLKIMGESHDKFTAIRDPGSIHASTCPALAQPNRWAAAGHEKYLDCHFRKNRPPLARYRQRLG